MSLLFIQLYTVKHYIFYLIFLNVFLHNNLLDLNESLGFYRFATIVFLQ